MLAGPIFVREIVTTPRRPRYYAVRAAYAAVLFALLWTAWQTVVGFDHVPSTGEAARFAALAFELLALTQMAVVLFAGSLYGAGSVVIEKERRTFVLLLVTRMTDAEIVVDKYLCGLLQIASMLASGLPVYFLLVLLGGVSFQQVWEVFGATLGGATVSIALGVLVGVWREKAFQALALTILGIVAGLVGVEIVAYAAADIRFGGASIEYWCACISPVRALFQAFVLEPMRPGFVPAAMVHAGVGMLATAFLLVIAIVGLRAWNPRGEPVQERESTSAIEPATGRRRSRAVWNNPVLWREIRTRAYGTRPVLIKGAYLAVSTVLLLALATRPPMSQISNPSHAGGTDSPAIERNNPPTAELSGSSLLVARSIIPAIILSLLLVNVQAAASVTSERDLKSMDLLLVTDLEPTEFVFGKIVGTIHNAKEMIAAPVLLLLVASTFGWISGAGFVLASLAYLVIAGFAIVLGIHAALRYDTSRAAISHSLGTMFLLLVGVLVCLYLIVISGRFEAQWASFILFIVLGSIGLWISLSANHPSSAITLAAATAPVATFYCILAYSVGDRVAPFLVFTVAYLFATSAMLVPMLAEFDVAAGRTTVEEG